MEMTFIPGKGVFWGLAFLIVHSCISPRPSVPSFPFLIWKLREVAVLHPHGGVGGRANGHKSPALAGSGKTCNMEF